MISSVVLPNDSSIQSRIAITAAIPSANGSECLVDHDSAVLGDAGRREGRADHASLSRPRIAVAGLVKSPSPRMRESLLNAV